jgi:predicted transposase YbfD/YdcC
MASEHERGWVVEHFAGLVDPRAERAKRHELLDIIVITICGVICGADNWVEIEEFGNARLEWLSRFLRLPNGIPSHDTFGRVFSRLDPDQFGACFMTWVRSVAELTQGEVVAIDGKTLRRCHDRGQGRAPLHLVSAWAAQNHLVLGQTRTQAHSNEITAIPQLLQMLELQGCIVTIDAMGCQQEIAQGILDRGAGYVLALKENQGQLYEDVRDLFEGAEEFGFGGVPHDYATTLNKDHGRIERRECWTISDPSCLEYLSTGQDWPGLCSVVKVVGRRETPAGTTVQPRYYISSLDAPAERLLKVVRTHWSIENSLHWSLDVTFGEDHCRIRKDHAPQNMATLRQVSHNLLKNETSLKVGIQGKRLQAGWKEDYLLKVLRS